MLRALRDTLHGWGYLEVPTPTLVPSPALEAQLDGVPAADGWLRTSPEFALKRVLAAGLPRIYEIGPSFRAGERGPWHAREFLILEWYRAGATLHDLQQEVTELVAAAALALGRPSPAAWPRLRVRELFLDHVGLPPDAPPAVLSPRDPDDATAAFCRRWLEDIEPHLPPACFITHWPASQAALSQVVEGPHGPVALRFEAFLHGVELANAFQELTDAAILRTRWQAANAARAARGVPPHPIDEAFVAATAALPASAGIALGVDRLVAALCGWHGIARGRADHPSFG